MSSADVAVLSLQVDARQPQDAINILLRLEIQAVAKNEHEKAEAFFAAFRANFAALSTEQRKFVQEHTPEITNKDQAKMVNTVVAMMAAL